jgi:hypothetical protein
VYGGAYTVSPDSPWVSVGGLYVGNGTILVPIGLSVKKTIAHETGHATKQFFERQTFGSSLDHSSSDGLMDRHASQNEFSAWETKILRGIKKP